MRAVVKAAQGLLMRQLAGVAVKPSCVNRAAIRALNRHVQPRVIHVVSGTLQQCAVFQARSPGLRM